MQQEPTSHPPPSNFIDATTQIATDSGMVLQLADGSVSACNSAAQQLLGLTIEQIQQWISQKNHPAAFALQTKMPCLNTVMPFSTADGAAIQLQIDAQPLFVANQSAPYAVVTTFTCVPSSLLGSTEFQDHKLLQKIADTTPGLLYVYDFVARRNLYINSRATEILGYTPQQLSAMGTQLFSQLLHPEDFAQLGVYSQQLHSTQDNQIVESEFRLRHANGEWRWLWTREVVFTRTADGAPDQILGCAQDITERKQAELELRRANERFELAAAAVNCMIYNWDIVQNTVERTEGLTRILGYSLTEAEPTAQWWSDRIHPEDLAQITQNTTVLSTSNCYAVEYRIRDRNNQYQYVFDQAIVLKNDAGQSIRAVGSTTNISDRKQTELENQRLLAQIEQERGLLEAVLQQMPAGVIIAEFPSGKLILGNQQVEQIWRHSFLDAEAIAQYEGYQGFHPDGRPLTPQEWPLARSILHGEVVNAEEIQFLRGDGTVGTILVSSTPIRNQQGEITAGVVTFYDISDRKQAEAAVRDSEQRYRYLAETIPQIVWTADVNGHTDYVNQQWHQYSGLSLAETINDGWQSVIHPDDVTRSRQLWYQAVQNHTVYEIEHRYRRAQDGTYRWHLVRGFPIKDEHGRVTKWIGTCTDIDDQKQLQVERTQLLEREQAARTEAETANRLKDEFLAVLSHELRSPLNPILGWTRLLQTHQFDRAKINQALATIERNAQLQAQLIDDLLDVSRILQGKLSLNVSAVDLVATISAAMETVRLAAEAKAIEIIFSASEFQHQTVTGDSNRLQQVVWNLLSNAVKFTPPGGKVEVLLASVDPDVQICIKDTGKGISSDFLPYVFDYFRQADSTTTRKFGGLGLGLAIARQLVELHGGTIMVESPGEDLGATFTIKLPQLQPQAAVSSASQVQDFTDPSFLADVRILVVDDEPDSCELVAFILEQHGAQTVATASASEALIALAEFQPDLLLSDIGMPEVDGYALIRQVRMLPQYNKIPAIALTAYASELDQQQALAAGFQMHLTKPVEPNQLLTVIAQLLTPSR